MSAYLDIGSVLIEARSLAHCRYGIEMNPAAVKEIGFSLYPALHCSPTCLAYLLLELQSYVTQSL